MFLPGYTAWLRASQTPTLTPVETEGEVIRGWGGWWRSLRVIPSASTCHSSPPSKHLPDWEVNFSKQKRENWKWHGYCSSVRFREFYSFSHNHWSGKLQWQETNIGDTPIFHWTMMWGRVKLDSMSINFMNSKCCTAWALPSRASVR